MTISDKTLSYIDAAFNTATTITKLLKTEPSVIFRIVSEIKMGWELWKRPDPTLSPAQAEQEKVSRHVVRPEEKSMLLALREPHDDHPVPFLFFCAYFPVKKTLQIVEVKNANLITEIPDTYRKFLPEDVYSFATCQVQKSVVSGINRYAFSLVTTMDKNFCPQVARSPIPEEGMELMKLMPFDLNKIYDRQDAFDV